MLTSENTPNATTKVGHARCNTGIRLVIFVVLVDWQAQELAVDHRLRFFVVVVRVINVSCRITSRYDTLNLHYFKTMQCSDLLHSVTAQHSKCSLHKQSKAFTQTQVEYACAKLGATGETNCLAS